MASGPAGPMGPQGPPAIWDTIPEGQYVDNAWSVLNQTVNQVIPSYLDQFDQIAGLNLGG